MPSLIITNKRRGMFMENISIEETIKRIYDERVLFIRDKNIELERQYFSSDKLGFLTNGLSYDDNFTYMIKELKKQSVSESKIESIFISLQEVFLFSKGHDMMFKKKLNADVFVSIPMDNLIYPMLVEGIKEKYNDVSVMCENPNYENNIKGIDKLTYIYTELQSLLYFLYCNDFQFPNEWEALYPDTFNDLIKILNESGLTIGEFLHSLIDFKCNIMNVVLKEIDYKELQDKYLSKVEKLRNEKHKETSTFAHTNLPVTYFLNHTFDDFMKDTRNKSLVLDNNKSNASKKIILN